MRFLVLSLCLVLGVSTGGSASLQEAKPPHVRVTDRPLSSTEIIRIQVVEAREAAWRAFFSKDPSAVEHALAPELIGIQENQEMWESREHLVAIAKDLRERNVELSRLEFPHTEMQVFGDTAILYYTYIFETTTNGKSEGIDAGRGTEIFVRRNGTWIDVGWHLDNGPFSMKEGKWVRAGSYPESGPVRKKDKKDR